eukprot:6749025-Prymnesium_polylepis.1
MYMPDEYIVREGIIGTSMYFIQRGTVREDPLREYGAGWGRSPRALRMILFSCVSAPGLLFTCRCVLPRATGLQQHKRSACSPKVALTTAGNSRRVASVISHTVLWLQRLNKADVYEIGRVEPL